MGDRRFAEALQEFEAARDGYCESGEALHDLRMQRYMDSTKQASRVRDQLNTLRTQINNAGDAQGTNTSNPSRIEQQIAGLEELLDRLDNIKPPETSTISEPPGEVYFWLGNAYFNLNRLPEATEAWKTCVTKSPKFVHAYTYLAVAQWRQGHPREALETLQGSEGLGLEIDQQMKADLMKAVSGAAPR